LVKHYHLRYCSPPSVAPSHVHSERWNSCACTRAVCNRSCSYL